MSRRWWALVAVGAVLRSRQGVALSHGVRPAAAFLDGYHAGLAVTIVLIAAGIIISYAAFRRLPATVAAPGLALAVGAEPGQAAGQMPGSAAGSESGSAPGSELSGIRS